jgi:hypothetical protein
MASNEIHVTAAESGSCSFASLACRNDKERTWDGGRRTSGADACVMGGDWRHG